ncbi:protein disulfide oxidoreductase [Thermaerobacter litoralis]
MKISEQDRREIQRRFEAMESPVVLKLFIRADKDECPYCEDTRQLLEAVAELDDRITLEVHDVELEPELAERHGVDMVPAILFARADGSDTGMRFYGIPAGYEFGTLIDDIVDVSRGVTGLSPETEAYLRSLDTHVHLQVFVTPTCPYCPRAVRLAHKMALASDRVRADAIEAMEFPDLANRFAVFGVPKTVVNGSAAVEGAAPEPHLLALIKEALS